MTKTNILPQGLLIVVALFACTSIVTSACGAAFPGNSGVSLISYYPIPQAGGFAYEDYSAFSSGTPVGVNPAGDGQATSDIVTDQELIALVRSLNYPGIDKSIKVITNQSNTGDILDIRASSEDGVLITRSPFTTRIHIGMLQNSTARNIVDPLNGFDPMSNSFGVPGGSLFASNQYITGRQTGPIIPDIPEGLNLPSDLFNQQGQIWTNGGFVYPPNRVSPLMPLTAPIMPLPAIPSPLSPFNSLVLPGGYSGTQLGSDPGSALGFHDSRSATGMINNFLYQAGFSTG